MAFMNDRCSVFLVLGLAGESELILGLAVGNLVNAVGDEWEVGKWEAGEISPIRRRCVWY